MKNVKDKFPHTQLGRSKNKAESAIGVKYTTKKKINNVFTAIFSLGTWAWSALNNINIDLRKFV